MISTPLKSIFLHLKKVIFVEWFFRPLEFNYVQENKFLLDCSYFFQAHIIILKPRWHKLLNSCSFLEDCEWIMCSLLRSLHPPFPLWLCFISWLSYNCYNIFFDDCKGGEIVMSLLCLFFQKRVIVMKPKNTCSFSL